MNEQERKRTELIDRCRRERRAATVTELAEVGLSLRQVAVRHDTQFMFRSKKRMRREGEK